MSKIVHPYAHRLVTLRDWKSRWFSTPKNFKNLLRDDVVIREYLEKRLRGSYVSSIEIERSPKMYKILIRTSRPGVIIGRSGEGSIKLKNDILTLMNKEKLSVPKELRVDIVEVQNPDGDASLVAQSIAEGLEKRLMFRRVMKQTVEKVMGARNVQGVRILLGGRLGGAEIARTEGIKRGSIPLQTIRADVDFARERAHLPYGDLGIKVWIYKGEVFNDKKLR